MTYDTKCYDLAVAFLRDQETSNQYKRHVEALAKRIQQTIEDYRAEEGLGNG